MNLRPPVFIALLLALAHPLVAGESALTTTYQPLDGLGSGQITISPVACHDWYSHSGQSTAIGLISAPNVPPTNNPKVATADLNLASVCNIRFRTSDLGDPKAQLELIMDVSAFSIPKRCGHSREDVLRASLECLRRCLPEKLQATPVKVVADERDRLWLAPIVKEFNEDRTHVFYPVDPSGKFSDPYSPEQRAAAKSFRSYLSECPESEIRCLWFLHRNPGVGMIMAFDFRDRTIFTERHAYSWARRVTRYRGISLEEIIAVRGLLPLLPVNKETVTFADGVHVSFWQNGELRTVTYNRSAVPPEVKRLYEIGGGPADFVMGE